MSDEIKKICWFTINGKELILLSNNWKGSPLIAYKTDYVLMSETDYKKYEHCFIGEGKKNKIIFI